MRLVNRGRPFQFRWLWFLVAFVPRSMKEAGICTNRLIDIVRPPPAEEQEEASGQYCNTAYSHSKPDPNLSARAETRWTSTALRTIR